MSVPWQLPPAHRSLSVQALPSSQGSLLLTCVQPVEGLQPSSVQMLLSLQSTGSLTQVLFTQCSLVVHWSVSAQSESWLHWQVKTCWQPAGDGHESTVHGLPSSQLGVGPGTQLPPAQVSFSVQLSLSLQGAELLVWVQPEAVLQPSSVHGLPSLQLGAGPPTQLPPAQASPVVHALPSLHGSLLFTCVQPVAGLQPSSVQMLLSLQLTPLPPQVPLVHTSPE